MANPYAKFTMSYQEAVEIDNTIPTVLDFGIDSRNTAIRQMVMDKYWNYEIAGETIGEFKSMLKHTFGTIKDYYNELIDAYETKINMLDGRKTTTVIDESTKKDESGENSRNKTDKITSSLTSKSSNSTEGKEGQTSTYSDSGTDGTDTTNETSKYDLPRSANTENRPSYKDETTGSSDRSYSESATGSLNKTTNNTATANDTSSSTRDATITDSGSMSKTISGTRDKSITITGGDSVIKLKKEYMALIKNIYRECAGNLQKCFLDLFF